MAEYKNIILTRGCGFIGSNFARRMARERSEMRMALLGKLAYEGNPENITGLNPARFKSVAGDICDAALATRIVSVCDVVARYSVDGSYSLQGR